MTVASIIVGFCLALAMGTLAIWNITTYVRVLREGAEGDERKDAIIDIVLSILLFGISLLVAYETFGITMSEIT